MLDRLARILVIGLMSAIVVPTGAWAQAPAAAKAPQVKDQGEYDIANAAGKETDPVKKLALLRQWEQKYPDSDFKGNRDLQIAQAESQIAAKAVQPNASPADLAAAQKAAQDLIDNLDKYLAPANKPAAATDAQWAQAKSQLLLQAHMALAAVYVAEKNDPGAESEYKKILAADPNSAATAYQLGILIYRTKDVKRFPEAFFWIARAIEITGPEALKADGKQAADKYLQQAYSGYHGDTTGLDDLKKMASTATAPPAGFSIKSVQEIQQEQASDAAAFAAAHPDLALWRQIRDALKGDGGDAYFAQVKDSEVPPQTEGAAFKMFTGKVVSQPSPKEILLNVDNPAGDATLEFEGPIKGTIDPGTEVKFKGGVDSFTKDPYNLTFKVDKDDVEGLPASAFATTGTRKRATKKK